MLALTLSLLVSEKKNFREREAKLKEQMQHHIDELQAQLIGSARKDTETAVLYQQVSRKNSSLLCARGYVVDLFILCVSSKIAAVKASEQRLQDAAREARERQLKTEEETEARIANLEAEYAAQQVNHAGRNVCVCVFFFV